MRLIDADELKRHQMEVYQGNGVELENIMVVPVANIDNAPTVPLPDFKEGYKQAIIDGKTNFSKPQGEWVKSEDCSTAYRCSNCKCLQHWSVIQDGRYKYCPNCGAQMKDGAKIDSCETCMFKYQPEYCELNNKKLYGFCGNFTRLDGAVHLPRIYKCPKCLYLFNGRDDPDKCPRCGANVKKGGAE